MKIPFYTGAAGISIFEILNVFFIMPMPGSQDMNSLNIAYFLYSHRWLFRIIFFLLITVGIVSALKSRYKWVPVGSLLIASLITYFFNFRMTAEQIFRQPGKLVFKSMTGNRLDVNSMVISVGNNGQVKGYPIQFLVYHHQVQDTIGGKPFMVTYCSVCRTGRVYKPLVKGHTEKFRLVGMDHFNAMFEDITTKSWWRQVTGEAVTGPLKGESLPEVESEQLTIKKLFDLHPDALVMQPDKASMQQYDSLRKFEQGLSKGKLTRTDSLSWKNKSWVIGIKIGSAEKVFDWNQLKENRIINDDISGIPVFIVLSSDGKSFGAFERPLAEGNFSVRNDTLTSNGVKYDFSGHNLKDPSQYLKPILAYQEFWHSWTFHPGTLIYR